MATPRFAAGVRVVRLNAYAPQKLFMQFLGGDLRYGVRVAVLVRVTVFVLVLVLVLQLTLTL